MHLLLVGVSHRTAPVELRERLDFSARGVGQALSAFTSRPSGVPLEAVVLSTCNRAEMYLACANLEQGRQDAETFFAEFHRLSGEELAPHVYVKRDLEVVRHLFRVAAGLDSLVVGEPQILGQVKDAYGQATAQKTTGPLLNRLFTAAFTTGKRVRSETSLSEGAVSVSYAAVALARKIFGDLKGRTVVVIGAGEMGKLTALHMKSQGIKRILLTSRTFAHAESLARTINADVIPWEHLPTALSEADIVITATGASTPILSRQLIAGAMRPRRHRPLFLIDIAVPRDVDPEAGIIEQVFLYNIDDLQAVVTENLSKRRSEIDEAEAIVADEVTRFGGWMQARGAIPTVIALRQRFEAVRRSELERLEPKLAGLPPEARARVEEVTRLVLEKLLISPTEQLKALSDGDSVSLYAEVLSRLFGLTGEAAELQARGSDRSLKGQDSLTPSMVASDLGGQQTRRKSTRSRQSS